MTNPVLPKLELAGIKFNPVGHAGADPAFPKFASEVTIHCKGQTDAEIGALAKVALERQIQSKIAALLVERNIERPKVYPYFFDHRRLIVSGSTHALQRVLNRMSIGPTLPYSVFIDTPEIDHLVLEVPALYIQETENDLDVLNWYLAQVHINVKPPALTCLQSPTNYLANYVVYYQIELAEGNNYKQYASQACIT